MKYKCRKCLIEFLPTENAIKTSDYVCKDCRSEYFKKWQESAKAKEIRSKLSKNYRSSAEYRLKKRAWDAVKRAVDAGKLTKQPCENCGHTKTHAHHDDYNKKLDVRWLCHDHHMEYHKGAK